MNTATILNHRYQLTDQLSNKLGRKTFVADDLKSQHQAIVKILQFNAEFQWEDLKLFEREVVTLQNLNHPSIPKYLDSFELADGFALVQTYIDAPSLETVLREGRKFSEAEVIELATRLLDILAYLHEQKPPVIHRDIKPSNILLANRSGNSVGDVYLVDFGSVQTVASKEGGTITIVGSYGYIPLEQFGGQTRVASDLYSLGMTLIYLLTGNHPAELEQINGQVKFTAEISSKFERWLTKITQPHLDKRFDSAKLARTALTSEDGSYGDFVHLKPVNSKIQLHRDREKLEIRYQDIDQEKIAKLNSIQVLPSQIFIGTLISFFILPLLSIIVPAISFLISALFPISIISFMLMPILPLVAAIIKANLKPIEHRLTINDKYICRSKKDKSPFHRPTILSQQPRSQVEILAYNPGYTFDKCLDSNGSLVKGSTISIPPKLYLSSGAAEHLLFDRYSPAELWWLGQELSDFLNLELQVIYPTPKVPPVPSCGGGC